MSILIRDRRIVTADVVGWDSARKHTISARTHRMRVDYSMYEGFQLPGDADRVTCCGGIVVGWAHGPAKPDIAGLSGDSGPQHTGERG